MELVAILRLLWGRRVLVTLGAVAALAAGLLAGGGSPDAALASARMVLDTPVSQLAASAPRGADNLARRAAVLGNLLATEPARARIARQAGVPRDQLAVVNASARFPALPTTLALRATEAAGAERTPYTVSVAIDELLPVVSIDVLAPDRRAATRVAEATAGALRAAAAQEADHVVVSMSGATQAREVPGSVGRVKALGLALATFALWCGCVVFVSLPLLRRRSAATRARPA